MSYNSLHGSPLFEAMWGGKCPECEERWEKEEMIGYVSEHEKPVCEDCHNTLDTIVPDPNYYF
jgi:NAD-dependent SIR2 family protein deacetylase